MDNDILYKDDKYEVKFDQKYGYYHLFPIPSKQEVKEYYAQEFYDGNYDKQINDSSREVQDEEEEFINMQFSDIIDIIEKEAPGKRIIDIGCGYGNFLKYAKDKGYQVAGCDPAPEAVEYAKQNGIEAFRADIEEIKEVEKKYDVAVMLNVLEHLREPYRILEDIKNNLLNDKGILVIRTPNEFNNLQTIANKEYDLKSWWVAAPQHISYFTVDHLVNLINNSGYEVFLKEANFPMELFLLFGDKYVGDSQLGKAMHNKRVLFEKTLKKHDNDFKRKMYQCFAEIGMGREITVYARKK
jgi:2-polyprenyl-3-methyl-5-hydroxy-6-metoxy-1,4-benzoquinol methylase